MPLFDFNMLWYMTIGNSTMSSSLASEKVYTKQKDRIIIKTTISKINLSFTLKTLKLIIVLYIVEKIKLWILQKNLQYKYRKYIMINELGDMTIFP